MKIQLIRVLFLGQFVFLNLDTWANERYPLIPQPLLLIHQEGEFVIDSRTQIMANPDDPALAKVTDFLKASLEASHSVNMGYAGTRKGKNVIVFSPDPHVSHDEGYEMDVTERQIRIGYKTAKGAFMAVQTIRQLLPAESGAPISVPAVKITDYPRFGYRGAMLDVARHYFPVDFIMKYIDILSFYKINTFHIHLNDDQGWRMEVKKYPRLQEVGAWRKETRVGHRTDTPRVFDGKRHGGFYTHEELREIVAYADARFMTVIPEIDIPGHSQALLAAYPHLGCRDTTYEVSTDWGVHKEILCPKEETFRFLEDVFDEVVAIFPGQYIHIGGDEVPKDRWKESAFCQQLINKLGLKDEHELQSYFIKRVERFLNSKGKTIIGWDEILEGGLAPNAAVMSWRGEQGGIAAARLGHPVIMSPKSFMYLDYYQTPERRKREPLANSAFLPLAKVYAYDPIPDSLSNDEAKYILGPQANVWGEYIATPEQVELMTFPRLCAMAEVGWSIPERKDYDEFLGRLHTNIRHLRARAVNVAEYELKGD